MKKFSGPAILAVGMVLGWFLHSTVESTRVTASKPLMEHPVDVDQQGAADNELATDFQSDPEVRQHDEPESPDYDHLIALLSSGSDVEAIEWYLNLRRTTGTAKEARRLINRHVNLRQQQGHTASAINLMKLLVTELPQAFDERVTLATLYKTERQYYQSLTVLFDTLAVASSTAEITQVDLLIQQTVAAAQKAMGEDDIKGNITLYEFLIQHRAAHTPYYIELAAWLIKASRLDGAMEQLDIVRNDPFVGDTARQMMRQIVEQRQREAGSSVSLVRQGSHFIVDAVLNENDVRLLLDTGASVTVLSREAAKINGLLASEPLHSMQINTANGTTEAFIYRVSSISIDEFVVSPIDIAVVEALEIEGAAGLLGMNFLAHFDFRIDQTDAQLFLKYRD